MEKTYMIYDHDSHYYFDRDDNLARRICKAHSRINKNLTLLFRLTKTEGMHTIYTRIDGYKNGRHMKKYDSYSIV